MKINLTPQLRNDRLSLSVEGDVLTANGVAHDFSALLDGEALSPDEVGCPWLASSVVRAGGQIELTIILPHGTDAPEEARFPQSVTVSSGPVPLPG